MSKTVVELPLVGCGYSKQPKMIFFENQQPKSYKCNYFGMTMKLDNQKKNKEGFAEIEHTTIGESQSTLIFTHPYSQAKAKPDLIT